jgi:ankyrin repeat protein
VIKSTKGRSVDYDVAVSLQLPMAWWFGINILKGQLSVSFPRQNTLTLRHPSYFAIARVLDYSHPFFKACESNDVAVVQEMLRNGEGRPTDEDPGGYDPLWVRFEQAYIWPVFQLTEMQYAAHHSSVEVLAELLENGANIDAKTGHMQNTLLEVAASHRHLDVLRTLLHRGASTDQCDRDGVDIHFFCWASKDYSNKGTSAIETANVLSEYMVLDSKCTWQLGTVLHVAAMFLDGHDIDTLISHSYDIEAKGDDDWTPIAYALEYGNASAYFALLAHGADLSYSVSSVESMLHRAVISHAQKPNVSFLPFPEKADYESIIKHILQHGHPSLDLTSPSNHELEEYPPSIHGRKVTPKQLAEAFGPKTEAWFLTLLRESGQPHHFTKEDKRRLHFLRLEGYARQGCVLGDDDEFSEDDEIYQCGNTTGEYGGGDDGGDDDDHEGNASSTHDGASDMGEEEQFWDAEQDLWSG